MTDTVALGETDVSLDGVAPDGDGDAESDADKDNESVAECSRDADPHVDDMVVDCVIDGVTVEDFVISREDDGEPETLGVTEPIDTVGVFEVEPVTSPDGDGDREGDTLISELSELAVWETVMDLLNDAVTLNSPELVVERVCDVVFDRYEYEYEILYVVPDREPTE